MLVSVSCPGIILDINHFQLYNTTERLRLWSTRSTTFHFTIFYLDLGNIELYRRVEMKIRNKGIVLFGEDRYSIRNTLVVSYDDLTLSG